MSSMKAVRIHAYGGTEALVYEDAPRPKVGDDDVLIRVHATSVNPFDCAVRAGYLAGYYTYTFPLILGCDAAGVVEEVGAGVHDFRPGDNVYARVGIVRDGAYAEYVAAPTVEVAHSPKTLDALHAAALPHVTLTAWQALFETAQLAAGQTLLIHAAAGGVGHIAVQLAKVRGAKVIGTASGRNLDFLRELGVDEAIDYKATPFETIVAGVDVVLDTIGGDTQQRSWQVIKPGGILVSIAQPPSEELAAAHGVRQQFIYASPPVGKTLTEIASLVDSGKLKPVVSTVLPLSEIRQAHAAVEGKHVRGKLVLSVA